MNCCAESAMSGEPRSWRGAAASMSTALNSARAQRPLPSTNGWMFNSTAIVAIARIAGGQRQARWSACSSASRSGTSAASPNSTWAPSPSRSSPMGMSRNRPPASGQIRTAAWHSARMNASASGACRACSSGRRADRQAWNSATVSRVSLHRRCPSCWSHVGDKGWVNSLRLASHGIVANHAGSSGACLAAA